MAVGKVSMEPATLEENIRVVMDAIMKAKPSAAKGTYLKNLTLSSTLSPGIRVELSEFK